MHSASLETCGVLPVVHLTTATIGTNAKRTLRYCAEPAYGSLRMYRLFTDVFVPPSDIQVSQYLFTGTTDEIMAYLCPEFTSETMLERVRSLPEKQWNKVDAIA